MKYDIIVSERVFLEINDILEFVRSVSLEASQKLYKEIITGINSLKELPLRCERIPILDVLNQETRKLVLANKRYILLFYVKERTVFIRDVIDVRKDLK